MDLALPYVTANLCALFIVGFLAATGNSRSVRLRSSAVSRARKAVREKQAMNTAVEQTSRQQQLAKIRAKTQAQTVALTRAVARDTVQYKPRLVAPKITGAGVLLIQVLSDDLTVILFKNVNGGKFMDPGGKRNGDETPQQCATRELEEESVGTFQLDITKVTAYPVKHVEYQGMFVAVECDGADDIRDVYDDTQQFIRTNLPGIDLTWKETTKLSEFFIADIQAIPQSLAPAISDTYAVNDTDGKPERVSDRVIGLVRKATADGTLDRIAGDFAGNRMVKMNKSLCPDGIGKRGSSMRAATKEMTTCWTVAP